MAKIIYIDKDRRDRNERIASKMRIVVAKNKKSGVHHLKDLICPDSSILACGGFIHNDDDYELIEVNYNKLRELNVRTCQRCLSSIMARDNEMINMLFTMTYEKEQQTCANK